MIKPFVIHLRPHRRSLVEKMWARVCQVWGQYLNHRAVMSLLTQERQWPDWGWAREAFFPTESFKREPVTWECYQQASCAKGEEGEHKALCWMCKVQRWCRKKGKVRLLLHDVLPVGFPHRVHSILMRGKDGFMVLGETIFALKKWINFKDEQLLIPRKSCNWNQDNLLFPKSFVILFRHPEVP